MKPFPEHHFVEMEKLKMAATIKYGSLYALRSLLAKDKLSLNDIEPLLNRHLMPLARNPKTFSGNATSMIDISDGLLIDLSRICDESKVGARIYTENIPLSAELKKVVFILKHSTFEISIIRWRRL